ncbi:cell wall anchor domain-containing protein [Listeria floridensis FSL S10-1187]|uniref:Cell wall anchor domain-containing protein n=1 Tax=Listeria floridensis FSL S10-1187 TaxID=1265817 RepID=A0ABN0REA6_9LIST|nr:Ig-like domain-containing protein [Listeria floridensis]EUJ30978.1 cell wall anchor domain-containing protein [Listeria floridensis FSL S10-1187]
MKKTTKIGCGLLALSIGLALPTSVFATSAPETDKADAIVAKASESEITTQAAQTETESAKTTSAAEQTETVAPSADQVVAKDAQVKENTETKDAAVTPKAEAPTVKAAVPFATAKANVTVEVNASAPVGFFVTPKDNTIALSFKTNPDVRTIGSKTVVIEATDGATTEEITVKYVVKDTKAPVITLQDEQPEIWLDEEWTPDDFVFVEDNSGDYTLSFANGKETLDTSKAGKFSTVIVARDAAGNESRMTVNYEVIDPDELVFEGDFDAPVIDKAKSTATDIYGTTEPYAYVVVFDENDEFIGEADADANGNFHIKLDRALAKGETVYLVSLLEADDYDFLSSDVAEYTYNGNGTVTVKPAEPAKTAPIKNAAVSSSTEKASLPKTGDSSTDGFVAVGALATLLATLYLRKRS